jgi:hypothetical protein
VHRDGAALVPRADTVLRWRNTLALVENTEALLPNESA